MDKGTCSVGGCDRGGKLTRGWCAMHYCRWQRHGDPETVLPHHSRKGPPPECSVDGCESPVIARGWCGKHYRRWSTHGDPLIIIAPSPPRAATTPAEERFWAKVDRSAGQGACWLWTASLDGNGYGQFYLRDRTTGGKEFIRAHRFAYESQVGPIPKGMHIDHVRARGCTNRSCVNPAHLEPVTPAENVRRARLEECPYGHPYSPENVYEYRGKRLCRECRRKAQRAFALRRKTT